MFWQELKGNRFFSLILCFAVLTAVAVLFFTAKYNLWIWLILLLCPLAHIFIMKGHGHSGHSHEDNDRKGVLYKCPECELEYEEKSWAEKCEVWCKEHHTCNVEITRHAKVENKK